MKDLESRGLSRAGAAVAAVVIIIAVVAVVYFSYGTAPATKTSSTTISTVQVVIPLGVGKNQSLNFEPSTITVVIGVNNTIEWVDQDSSAQHSVTATSVPGGATMFNSNETAPLSDGNTFLVTLTVPGTYHYHCSFHPIWMMGTIVVKQG